MTVFNLANSTIRDVEAELQNITASFKTAAQIREDIQGTLLRCAVTAHVHGDIRPVVRVLEFVRTEAPAGLNVNRMAEWVSRNVPAHYSTTKLVWVFNAKKRRELTDSDVQELFLDKWYANARGKVDSGFKPINPVARLKAQAKAWSKALDEQGDAAGVTTEQLNALLTCIRSIEFPSK